VGSRSAIPRLYFYSFAIPGGKKKLIDPWPVRAGVAGLLTLRLGMRFLQPTPTPLFFTFIEKNDDLL
jgi:hypothetical protein